jgi:hypothetical protein
MNKTMVIGLRPYYSYPGKLELWNSNNTLFAANNGASLITRAIMKEFDADYVDDFSDIPKLKEQYDLCLLSLSTHIHERRDVTFFVDAIEKLDMKTVIMSIGIQDYTQEALSIKSIHPSALKLLQLVSDRSGIMGCRGESTQDVIERLGFKNVTAIGCPTLFWPLKKKYRIHKKQSFLKPMLVFHRILGSLSPKILEKHVFLGQDYQDEAIFTNHLVDDESLQKYITFEYQKIMNKEHTIENINRNGRFVANFEKWFQFIGEHDFVVGPRIHGCIASLIQGIPAVVTPRDARVKELVDFFSIPQVSFDDLNELQLEEIYEKADFRTFNSVYKKRYLDFLKFLDKNEVLDRFTGEK